MAELLLRWAASTDDYSPREQEEEALRERARQLVEENVSAREATLIDDPVRDLDEVRAELGLPMLSR